MYYNSLIKSLFPALVLLFLAQAKSLRADTLDWDTVTWTAGSWSQSFTVGSTTISFNITGDTTGYNESGFPYNNVEMTGGFAGQRSLQIWQNSWSSNTQSLTVTITFSQAVSSVSVPLFDIDRSTGNYVDQIRNISATDGTNTYAASISNTGSTDNTIANNNTLTATITGTGTAADNTGDANATLSFSSPVTSISFTYGNGPGAPTNPNQQAIGIGDIVYTVAVPEPSVCVSAFLLLMLAGIHCWNRRKSMVLAPIS